MRLHTCLLASLGALALAACAPDTDPAPTTPAADDAATTAVGAPPASDALEPAAEPRPIPDEAGAGGADAHSFTCESGHRVELVGEDMARVTLADGRVIDLPRKADGVAEYRGEALTFDLDDDGRGGVLGQDEVGGFDCEPAG